MPRADNLSRVSPAAFAKLERALLNCVEEITRVRHDDRTNDTPMIALTACVFSADEAAR